MLESLNYSFRNPKNIIWVIYRIKQLRNYKKKKHGVLRGPQLDKQRWRARLGILRVKRICLPQHMHAFIVSKDPSASNFPSALSVTEHPADISVTSSCAKILMSQPKTPEFQLIFTSIRNSNLTYWYKKAANTIKIAGYGKHRVTIKFDDFFKLVY